jgi:hypothetical protein
MNILAESIWTAAFLTILMASAWSFRTNGAWPAVWVIVIAALVDLSTAILPKFGVDALTYHPLRRPNAMHDFAYLTGFVAYGLLIAGVVFRKRQRFTAFHTSIAAMQVVWFMSFVAYLYALYIVPGATMR